MNYLIKIRFILQCINTGPYVIDNQQSSFELCNEINFMTQKKHDDVLWMTQSCKRLGCINVAIAITLYRVCESCFVS